MQPSLSPASRRRYASFMRGVTSPEVNVLSSFSMSSKRSLRRSATVFFN